MKPRPRFSTPPFPPRPGQGGFTLLEVLVAFTIFFLFAFSVLELTTRSLAAARAIQVREPDAGLVAGMIALTNQLVEGFESDSFEAIAPGLYPTWEWGSEVVEVGSNGLFMVDVVVYRDARDKGPAETRMQMLLYRPESPPGSASGGGF